MEEEVRVLFVDDEQNILNAIKRAFLDESYTILTATSGMEGIALLEKDLIQVVISDYRMPDMNGIEFLAEVNRRWPQTVRIVLSGYADTASIVAAVNEGHIYKFVAKPWNDNELRVTISNAIERYFLYRRNEELTVELSEKNKQLRQLNEALETLLNEESESLEFRSKVVTAYQNILDAIPAGIFGIDSNNIMALCNSMWIAISGKSHGDLDQPIDKLYAENLARFIAEVNTTGSAKKRMVINGIKGILSGVVMRDKDNQEGIILVFMREDDM